MRYTLHGSHSSMRGFTMIDVVVWVSIFLISIMALVSSVVYFYRTNRFAVDQASSIASAQRGIDTMVRVMREAAYSTNGAYPVISFSANSFSFYADLTNDGYAEQIRFFLESNQLKRGVVSPAIGSQTPYSGAETISVISSYVRNDASTPLFQYYDAAGVAITNYSAIASVRFVVATLVADVDPLRTPTLLTFRSSATLRNVK